MPLPLAAAAAGTATVDWWARGIAAGGFAVALLSLSFTWSTYRRGGARLTAQDLGGPHVPWYAIFRIHRGIWMRATVRNRGLAPMEIENGWWEIDKPPERRGLRPQGLHQPLGYFPKTGPNGERLDKPPVVFPVTVAGHHAARWSTCPPTFTVAQGHNPAYRMRLAVRLGTGKVIRSRWIIVNDGVDWAYIKKLAGWRRIR